MSSETKPREKRSPDSGTDTGAAAPTDDMASAHPGGAGTLSLVAGKPRLRTWFHYVASVFLAIVLVQWDPLQWNEASSNASQDLAYRLLIGPFYPTDHHDDVTVVLFNEATLGYLGATWPTALGEHAHILRNILNQEPRAVMVDFVFPDERYDPSVHDLQEVIQDYKDKAIPLYFARAEGTNLNWIRPDLSAATLTSIVRETGDGVSRTYEPCSKLSGGRIDCACDAGGNQFQACPPEAQPATPGSPVALTAAFELFGYPDGLKDGFDIRDPISMDVVWSNRLNLINDSWMRKKTPWGIEKLCLGIGSNLWDLLLRMWFTSEDYSFRQTCPYTTTVPAHGVLQAPNDPKLHEVLHDKSVFYGGDLTGIEDTVVPPTHVKLPGVYLHAMALDNLLTFDGKYKRSAVSIFDTDIAAPDLTLAVAVVLAITVVAFARSVPVVKADQIATGDARGLAFFRILWSRWRYWFLFNVFMFLVIVATCMVLYTWGGLSPKNWLGYWGLMTALSAMAKGRWVEGLATTITERFLPSLEPILFMEKRT